MENNYKINLTKKAEKFIKKQDANTQKRIIKAILELPKGDIKKLKGIDDIYRLRVGDFRVLFEKNDDELIIIVIDIGNRGQIYK
ncbi:type II toxin-antitoxin system RelE/ParE family toxin [Clostridium aestuarii]|uniref:Type II toxin-antitoxin system RelE/ParE family toxin n=1 Tax=Clostridium aestuarii TaxID=338193 RepID=A0ABT4CW63_9CLOT|nr:type II toxin-antitoxin system RelE/ParE family toxin [Clostridium aestuarii]MCY6483246.1 type II toxin-antitoxin system RelE/ParE family toxin [Clostridium aestuarii]